jgi:hypothetical protein
MARDAFSRAVVDRLAKRVGMKCACPDCRAPTSGPDGGDGVTNTGVAAHVTAASPGGARYDATLSSDARGDIANGIWLCQKHAKLVDDDELIHTVAVLRDWKDTVEHMAYLEARGYAVRKAAPFADLEKKAPRLVAEMRDDLHRQPPVRQFILLRKGMVYNNSAGTPLFIYHHDTHEYLSLLMRLWSTPERSTTSRSTRCSATISPRRSSAT